MDQQNNKDFILTPKQVIGLFAITIIFTTLVATLVLMFSDPKVGLLTESLMILPAVVFVVYKRYPVFKSFRLRRLNIKVFFYAIAIGLCVFVLTDELDRLLSLIFPMPDELFEGMKSLVTINSFADGFILVLSAVVFAGIAEEMLFRGVLQQTLEHHREPAIAIVLTSVFFALVHFNPWTAIQITVLGLVLGFISWKVNSIIPAIFIHGLNNLLSIIFINTPEENLYWYSTEFHVKPVWLIAAAVSIGPIFVAFLRECEKRH